VSCVGGWTVFDTELSEGHQDNARKVGRSLWGKLLDSATYLHGHGLYQGVEIIKQGGEPRTMEAKALCERIM
jgi:hypothetical protein